VHRVALDQRESLRLLASTPLGRVVFTQNALPMIRPVNHVLVDGLIMFRTHEGAAIARVAGAREPVRVVLAFEADSIDPVTHTGWSVIATGYASLVDDPQQVARFAHVPDPWLDEPMHYLVCMMPELVDGFRLQ
jgi:hypothetical protein